VRPTNATAALVPPREPLLDEQFDQRLANHRRWRWVPPCSLELALVLKAIPPLLQVGGGPVPLVFQRIFIPAG